MANTTVTDNGTQTITNKTLDNTNTLPITSDPTGVTGADQVTNVVSLTQAEYDAITPDASTFYIITT